MTICNFKFLHFYKHFSPHSTPEVLSTGTYTSRYPWLLVMMVGLIVHSHVDDVHTFKSSFVPGRHPEPFQMSGLGTNKMGGGNEEKLGKKLKK